jgi:hypothetical protein
LSIAFATAGSVAGSIPASTMANSPELVSMQQGWTPIVVDARPHEIANLHVGSGRWLVWATLTTEMNVPTRPVVTCTIQGGQGGQMGIVSRYVDPLTPTAFSADLDGAASASFGTGGGTFVLACASNRSGPHAARIRLLAMHVPDLTRFNLPHDGPAELPGSASAMLLTAPGIVTLPDGTWTTVATVAMPDGEWWLHGSLTAVMGESNTQIAGDVRCRLRLGGAASATHGMIIFRGAQLHAFDLGVHLAPGIRGSHTAGVQCLAHGTTMSVQGLSLTAVRAGSMTRNGPDGWSRSSGSGDPRMVHRAGASDSTIAPWNAQHWTTLASTPVPAGTWAAKAVLMLRSAKDGNGGHPSGSVSCVLDAGGTQDTDTLGFVNGDGVQSLAVIRHGSSAGTLTLRCSLPASNGGMVVVDDVQITLVKVSNA